MAPDAGRITTVGRVAALIELGAGFNPILTGRENIYTQAALLGFSRSETRERFDSIVDFAEIEEFLDTPVQNYSSGMRVRLGFAVAAQMSPDILIVDEVLAVGDVAFRFKCLNAIGELMRSSAVILVSHSMPQIFRVCTQVMLLDHATVKYHGPDVAEGVTDYLKLASTSEAVIAGSGEVSVSAFRAESRGSQAEMGDALIVAYGSSLKLHAKLKAEPHLDSYTVQFVFWNAEMLPVLDVMSDGLKAFIVRPGEAPLTEVTAAIDRLELNAGRYSISVMSSSVDGSRAYCRHDNVAFVQVTAGAASGAHSLAVGSWAARSVNA
jgi:lipopolysaccharide transport system ATP-binding protein